MDTTVTLGQLIGWSIAIIGAGLYFWNDTNVRLKVLEMKVSMHDDIIQRIEELKDAIHNLDIKLTTKVDRDEKH
jgi:hypothetical protein